MRPLRRIVQRVPPEVVCHFPSSIEVQECSAGGFPRIWRLGSPGSRLHDKRSPSVKRSFCTSRKKIWVKTRLRGRKVVVWGVLDREHPATTFPAPWLARLWFVELCLLPQKMARRLWPQHQSSSCDALGSALQGKGIPTSRSEYSHPGVVILLTAPSYYYGVLIDEYVRDALEHLARSD